MRRTWMLLCFAVPWQGFVLHTRHSRHYVTYWSNIQWYVCSLCPDYNQTLIFQCYPCIYIFSSCCHFLHFLFNKCSVYYSSDSAHGGVYKRLEIAYLTRSLSFTNPQDTVCKEQRCMFCFWNKLGVEPGVIRVTLCQSLNHYILSTTFTIAVRTNSIVGYFRCFTAYRYL